MVSCYFMFALVKSFILFKDLAENLRSQLESGVVRTSNSTVESRTNNGSHSVRHNSSDEEDTEILTRQDKHGNLYPVKLKSDVGELNQKRRIKKKIVSNHIQPCLIRSFCVINTQLILSHV